MMHRYHVPAILCLASLFAITASAQGTYPVVGPPPPMIAPWARPSDTGRYVGYPVSGGNAHARNADAPRPDDGTWGWDYQGGWFHRRVMLGWWHGRRYQGGAGAYQTEGPKLLHPLAGPER